MGPPPAPGGKVSGGADRGTRPFCRGGMPKATSQIVTQSEAVDHLDKETVRDCVELFRDVHRYGYCSAKGVTLVEARNHPSRNTEQGRGGGVPLFDAVLGLACIQYLHDRRE